MGRGAQRFAFACASTSQGPSRSSSEHPPPPRTLYGLLRLYRSRVGSALSDFSWAVRGDSRSSRTLAATHSRSSPSYRDVLSIARTRARVRLLALPLVQPHPPACLHQCRLCRRVRVLQPVSEGGVLWTSEPVVSISLQCREFPDQRREIARSVPSYVLRVLWAHLRHTNPL